MVLVHAKFVEMDSMVNIALKLAWKIAQSVLKTQDLVWSVYLEDIQMTAPKRAQIAIKMTVTLLENA